MQDPLRRSAKALAAPGSPWGESHLCHSRCAEPAPVSAVPSDVNVSIIPFLALFVYLGWFVQMLICNTFLRFIPVGNFTETFLGDEDCLFLNVLSPRGAAKLPVLFWIRKLSSVFILFMGLDS